MKKIMIIIMFLGLANTAFAQRGGSHSGGGARSMGAGRGRVISGGGGRAYGGSFSARSSSQRVYSGGLRGGYGYGRYGYRPSGVGFGIYSSPVVYEPGYRPFCDPAWGPCGYPPPPYYGYGRPAIAVSIGVGGFAGRGVMVGGGWRRFGRR